jgi:uncharacterized damage-inducible protein DinB
LVPETLSAMECVSGKDCAERGATEESMKKLWWSAVIALVAIVIAVPAMAQDTKKEPKKPKPAPTVSQGVLDQWNDIGRKLIAMAEDIPEDKYSYKPNPDSRTWESQVIHAAAAMYYFTDVAVGKKARHGDDPKDAPKNRAELVAFVKQCVKDGADLIKAQGDKGMMATTIDPFSGNYTRRLDLAYGLIEHSGEHYGQLVVYYRAIGMVPPESRPKK